SIAGCSTTDHEESFTPTKETIQWIHNYYKDKEYFRFSIDYAFMKTGQITIESEEHTIMVNNTPCYKVNVNAQIKGAAGWLTSLNNNYSTYVDTLSLLPVKFTRDLQENKYLKKEFTLFHRMEEKAVVTDTTRKGQMKIDTFAISHNIQDMISAFFLLRNADFDRLPIGDTLTIDVFMENTSYNIKVKYLGKEKVKSKFAKKGKVDAFIIAPLIPSDGLLASEHPVKAWITDDEQKIPLKIQLKLVVGAVSMELQEYTQKLLY
ncbi:MAG TPA: DUF3108 domain-containing protein, partial [Cytophagaceae bacterium]